MTTATLSKAGRYAMRWGVPLGIVVDAAVEHFIADRERLSYEPPVMVRFRPRPGPLSKRERAATDALLADIRRRGGRRLR